MVAAEYQPGGDSNLAKELVVPVLSHVALGSVPREGPIDGPEVRQHPELGIAADAHLVAPEHRLDWAFPWTGHCCAGAADAP